MDKYENHFKLDRVSVRLVKDAPLMSDRRILNPIDAVEVIGKDLCELDREVMCVLHLKANGHPINCHIASIGALSETLAHPRELLKGAILSNASQILLIHNHPSFRLNPSESDVQLTDRMAQVCKLIGISLADHIIVGGENKEYFSFREKGILPFPSIAYESDYNNIELTGTKAAEPEPEQEPTRVRRHR